MKKYIIFLTFLLVHTTVMGQSFQYETRFKKTGDLKYSYTMTLKETEFGFYIESKGEQDSWLKMDKTFDSMEAVTRYENGDTIAQKREANTLLVQLLIDGESTQRKFKLDSSPWFADPSLGISRLVTSDIEKLKFWVINPIDDDIYKMVAEKQGEEDITLNQKTYPAVKVRWTMDGWKSLFWGMDLWYRKSDSVLLRQEYNEGPGTETLILSLVAESEIE